ncbi:MAG: hypoxanthine phosphoribosyltransferase [Clostridium argentinense]|uniref:Hypoxanthine phosphoribosyltransferase n=1 Tax=Clostridium faecium TaxID=2762223 RepID=A0ABR8YW91_9CLOT|nr:MULTISPECIES: hypoxanthine phosphoribosyltransferase [Clostridium]MBD8048542.1 hypoxanthine phosphoribosyltransferase [Clostridium faecium]MBS5824026.1 hypoxanthine phosphoribosyltransferase [Clostridium argentinense]MDU1350743.1 hypoxanthine phosphoribosyltransferase [Clostridium argentinense]
MYNDLKEVLLTEEQIKKKINELAARINEDYKGKDLLVLGILKGSVIFMSDLLKGIKVPCMMDFMAVSSYGNSSESSGIVKILKDLDFEVEGKHVLIVEDIIDSGITLKYLMKYLGARNPESLEIACLLNKPDRRKEELEVKYLGFDVPDYFLVGYGLDYAEKYRNLPYVAILKESVYNK